MEHTKEAIIKILDDKQVDNIVTLDFRNNSPFYDYLLIGSVRNGRMANAALEAVEEYALKEGLEVRSIDNNKESKWFLIDLGEIVVHIFYDGEREKYDLEGLWKDLIS